MTTKTVKDTSTQGILQNPVFLFCVAVAYITLSTIALITLDRGDLWFNLYNMVIYPLIVISPIVFISLPIPNWARGLSVACLVFILIPLVGITNQSYLDTAIQVCIYACFALGLNVVVGYAGLLDLGYVAFFAIGAYLWGMFTSTATTIFTQNNWVIPQDTLIRIGGEPIPVSALLFFIILGGAIAAVFGILLGLPVLRLRGDYLAIVTLGFGEVFRIIARNLDRPTNITNGALGLQNVAQPPADFLRPITESSVSFMQNFSRFRVDNVDNISQNLLIYAIALAILAVVIIVSYRLEHSPIGRAWTAIREDEVAAVAMGVPKLGMKLRAFAIGAAFGGAMGVLFSAKQQFIDPRSFELVTSIAILSMVIIGGLGGIKGVLFGAIVVRLIDVHILSSLSQQIIALKNNDFIIPIINYPIATLPTELDPTKFKPLIFGLILVTMMLLRPSGLIPASRRKLELTESR
jgi:branched-chain amino acid transport system permease protein